MLAHFKCLPSITQDEYVELIRVWLDESSWTDSSNLRNFTVPTRQMIRAHLILIFNSTNLP